MRRLARELPLAVMVLRRLLATATMGWAARGTAEGRRGLAWTLLDHTEPLSVSLACGSSSTKPEPDPSCVKMDAPHYERQ